MLKEKVSKIEFIDLQTQRQLLGEKISQAIAKVLNHANYILGPEVQELEKQLCDFTGASDVITCSNGTDALRLLLMAKEIGPGDAVFVPTFTFASTAEVVAEAKAVPVFIDVCPHTYNMDVRSLRQAIKTLDQNLKPKGIIAVDLFGMPADYDSIHEIADEFGLWVIGDAAQSFGGAVNGKKVGTLAKMTTASFFPSKPLACYGDGGAIFTMDTTIGAQIRSLRNHGCGVHRYDHLYIGLNSRLDTLQAAILIEKLALFKKEKQARNAIATRYHHALKDVVSLPIAPNPVEHAWGLYTIGCPPLQRETLIQHLLANGIPCNVYYRKPLHLQPAYQHFPRATASLQHAEEACQKVLSLPMHPYITDEQIDYIVHHVKLALRK